MSLFTDASLVYVPSGVKDAKTYSIKPTDGSGDLTFSRGSDIEATRVNANGYIEKAQVNLALQSNQFDTTWATTSATVTSGQAGYDGTNDAWLVLDTTGSGLHQIASGSLTLGGVYTSSVYAKAYSSTRYLGLAGFGLAGANEMPVFDLVNGTVDTGTTSTYFIDANIVSVGSGWYRCSVTFKYTGTSQLSITLCDTATDNGISGYTYTGTGTHGFYIQDAQLNYGLVAQTYQETTTAAVVSGITNDMPRLSYDPANPTCPSLLLEPSRQNLFTHDSYLSGWTVTSVTLTNNYATSPEGVQNATRLTRATSGNIAQNVSITSGSNYAISIFGKADTGNIVNITTTGDFPDATLEFDLSDQSTTVTLGSFVSYGIESYGAGWYRCWVVQTPTSSGTGTIRINTGDNISVLLYGAQCEAGSYSTSLIPTYGTLLGASRTADAAYNLAASSLIGTTEGVMFIDIQTPSTIGSNSTFSIGAGTSSEYAQLEIRTDLSINWRYRLGGTDYINANVGSFTAGSRLKIAFAYKNLDSALYLNGSSIATDTGTTATNAWDEVRFSNFAGTGNLEAEVNQALLFKTRLSNADLATLTSL